MLCILVRLLITSSTRSSVNEDRLDSLAAIEVSLHNRKLQFKHDMALFVHAHSIIGLLPYRIQTSFTFKSSVWHWHVALSYLAGVGVSSC